MVNKLYTVLRGGGEYRPEHVALLRDQLKKQHPDWELVCLSDAPSHHKEHCPDVQFKRMFNPDWPGWWSKLNLFHPDIEGDVLYCDLDTVLVGNLSDLFKAQGDIILRDFNRPHGLGSGLMKLTEKRRRDVWGHWILNSLHVIRAHSIGGDQGYLETLDLPWQKWQDLFPGQVISFKVDMRSKGINNPPEGTRVVCFHGKPRPWEVGRYERFWIDGAADATL